MNSRGTSAFFLFMMFVIVIILALALALPLQQFSNDAQGVNGLDCGNATTYQDRANCTSTDSLPWFYILILLGLGGILIKSIGR